MSLVNDIPEASKLPYYDKTSKRQSGTFNDPAQSQMLQSQLGVKFNFNADSLIPDMLERRSRRSTQSVLRHKFRVFGVKRFSTGLESSLDRRSG